MNRCPSDSSIARENKKNDKMNQIGRRFSDIFEKLLNNNYYEGTPFGQTYKRVNEDGTSKIYVKDPLEEKLKSFCDSNSNAINYLVGFTGMGKTTLIRNFFRIYDRDIHIEDNKLIIYISFYYANLNADCPQLSVELEVVKYLSRTATKIIQAFPELIKNEDDFWKELYEYIETNKPVSLQNEDITPDISLSNLFVPYQQKTIAQIRSQLSDTCKKSKIEYYSNMIKYLLVKIGKEYKVYLIFDDIESKGAVFHRPVVEVARHLHSCFSCTAGTKILIKTLVALRAYTYRSNIDRQLEARREQIQKNTIFKRKTVDLNEIFNMRFQELQDMMGTEEKAKEKTSYESARKQVNIVTSQINNSFESIILSLANCNLCNAMSMFFTILTNTEWIACESEYNGSFKVSADSYKLTAKTVFRALACGNEVAYSDKYNNFFPNLLYNAKEEGAELFNLLIIRYLIRKGATDLYGETYVQQGEIVQDIADVFLAYSDSKTKMDRWQDRIAESLMYMYDSGILLRSIYDIESLDCDQIERKYNRSFKLYVSPRGKFLYNLFSQNALLLELYRDSIYVDLDGNDRLTVEMRTYEVMKYLISYISKLFEYEKKILGDAFFNLRKYQECFGSELLISPLLEGVIKNIDAYYKNDDEEYFDLIEQVRILVNNIKTYIKMLSDEKGIGFKISSYINSQFP